MGRYGQAILTIVGTVVGFYFGYPALGAMLGGLAGQLLFPTKLPTMQGPRLSDISQTQSMVGASIPRVWGTIAVAGQIIHQTEIREVIESDEVGGKGGPTQTVETASYFQDFAVGLSDCPTEPIAGVRRIWANGKAIYDRTPQRDDETDEAFASRMAANLILDNHMTIYTGTQSQLPDPTLEAFYGVGNVSAHRGLAYIVFSNWYNKIEDGQRMPAQWKFEVYTAGTITDNEAIEYANQVLYPWIVTGGEEEPMNLCNLHAFSSQSNGFDPSPPGSYTSIGELKEDMANLRTNGATPANYMGSSLRIGGIEQITNLQVTLETREYDFSVQDPVELLIHYNEHKVTRWQFDPGDGVTGVGACAHFGYFFIFGPGASAAPVHTKTPAVPSGLSAVVAAIQGESPGIVPPRWDNVNDDCFEGGAPYNYIHSYDFLILATRVPRPPDDPCDPSCGSPPEFLPGLEGHCIVDGSIRRAGPWSSVSGGFNEYAVLAQYRTEATAYGDMVSQYPLNPVRHSSHPQYSDQAFWEAEYEKARLRGLMPDGLVYLADYPQFQNWAYRRVVDADTIETHPVDVDDIVRDLCVESGFDAADVNVTDLAGLQVIGYSRTRVMMCRAALDPLRQAKFFDGYESGRSIKFVRRGGAVARTFTNDELGIMMEEGDEVTRVKTRELQPVDLPRTVRVHYMSQARDYEPGEQQSPARVDTASVNDADTEIPIPMSDSEAKQIAQVLWADAWASRYIHEIVVDVECQELEPTDVVEIPVDGRMHRCRIVEVTDMLPTSRKFALVRDDDGAYESFAVADEPPVIPSPPIVYSPAEMIALDIPLLRDEDDGPGFYLATRPHIRGAFRGASVYRSTDGGGNFTRVVSIGNAAVTGRIQDALPAAGYAVPDYGTEIILELDDFDLSSITRQAMLIGASGSNAAAIGAHGRWEIIQFQDVEEIGDGFFKLTQLLRGRRGTEHAIGTSAIGDRFVLLSGPGIHWIPLQLSELGREYLYRAVGTGMTIDGATDVFFTATGVPLKPFSPVFIRGTRDPATGDWTISWIRRGRIGQTLPGGTDIPLSEELEDYEVVIEDEDGLELRVISTTQRSTVYDAAAQVTDFDAVLDTFTVRVYQLSAAVGRGYVGEAVLEALEPLA